LVAHPQAGERAGWVDGPIPAEAAIRGLHGTTLREAANEPTARLLTETLGFRKVAEDGALTRYATGAGGPGSVIDVLTTNPARGTVAVGTVHHIAWRTPNDAEQGEWLSQLQGEGHHVSPIMDRQYFHSIYFREPGGVLFEIATDPPGFATDETPEHLGEHLKLPPWLEVARADIEADLPKIVLAGSAQS
jgi:glyoxalase family protein